MGAYQRSVSPFEFPLAISSYRTKMLRLNTVGAPQKLVSSAHFRPSFAKQPSFARPSPQRVNVGHDRHVLRTFAAISQPVSAPQSTSSEMVQKLPPATLPGTVKNFPIPEDKLIKLAQKLLLEDDLGKHDDSVLADDFRFEFPIVKLDKKGYLNAVRTFDFKEAFPNFEQNAYDWRVDKFEPQRVWFTVRTTGTHLNDFKIFNKYTYKATGKEVYGAPEALSLTFNAEGKATSVTGGYVIDNRLGNTNKLGALYGLLQGIGVFVPHPQPGTLGWKVGIAVDTTVNLIRATFHFATLNIFKGSKSKSA